MSEKSKKFKILHCRSGMDDYDVSELAVTHTDNIQHIIPKDHKLSIHADGTHEYYPPGVSPDDAGQGKKSFRFYQVFPNKSAEQK